MHLTSLHCHIPSNAFTQNDCWDILQKSDHFHRLRPKAQQLLEKILHGKSGIAKRHFASDDIDHLFDHSAEKLNKNFEKDGPILACAALKGALEKANLKASDLDALYICTCTGYLCPGLTSHVAEKSGMRSNAFLSDLVGLGCGAAVPLLRQAGYMAKAMPQAKIACIAVEVCSSAFYLDNDPGVLISLCLFGDGASAVVLGGEETEFQEGGVVRFDAFQTLHRPENRQLLRFENAAGKLRNRLHRSVPREAALAVGELYRESGENGLDIIAHAGGRDVLDEVSKTLGRSDIPESRSVLRDFGNMSSPSVLFALNQYLLAQKNKANDFRVWATSFGAGFSCHSMTLSGVIP